MPTLPITVPYSFATSTGSIPLAYLDSDFSTVLSALNGIGSGATPLTNVAITGGSISGVSGIVTQDANFNASIAGTYVMGSSFLRNRLINGSMAIDQRNNGAALSVATGTQTYTVDRWYGYTSGAALNYQQIAGPTGYQYAMQITGAASNTYAVLGQKIESFNIADLAGTQVTIGFTARSTSLTTINYSVDYPTAVDNWATSTNVASGSVTINSTATYYSFQVTLPANAANGLSIEFRASSGITTGVLIITGVQIERGSIGTPFERRLYGAELALCQRYYFDPAYGGSTKAYYVATFGGSAGSFTSSSSIFPVTMRVTPTLTLRNQTYINSSAVTATSINQQTWYPVVTQSASGPALVTFNMNAAAEL